ncbi:MAG: cation:proton antiporter [Bacilli bacterium]
MILSIGLIIIAGFLAGEVLSRIKIPGLVGMIAIGMIIGPYYLNLIDSSVLDISSQLRQIALVIILTRSGLNLDLSSLKKVGRSAVLMCFIPATFEIVGVAFASFYLIGLSIFESILLGCVLSAVSPAVVSPRMIKLIEQGYGETKSIPKLVLAGSSVDDIYVIVLFYAFLGLVSNNSFDSSAILQIPTSIILGGVLGLGVGFLLSTVINRFHPSTTVNVILMLGLSFLLIGLESAVSNWVSFSSLVSIIVSAMVVLFKNKDEARKISAGYNKLWKVFEIILFVLVGATIDLSFALSNSGVAIVVLILGLLARTIGVYICLLGTKLNLKEKLFVAVAYLPKATVQASIGGIALSAGLSCGSIILTVAVLSIIITAPLGAFAIDNFSDKLLSREEGFKQENLIELSQS